MKKHYYFGDKLQELRKEHNLSQEALAEILDVSRQSVSKWESGKIYPEIDKLIFISNYFNISLDELIKEPSQEDIEEDIMPQLQTDSARKVINISKQNSFKEPSEQDIMPSGYEIPPVQPSADTPIMNNNIHYVNGIPKKKINRKKRWLRIIAASCFAAVAISFTIAGVYGIITSNRNNYYYPDETTVIDGVEIVNEMPYDDDFDYFDDDLLDDDGLNIVIQGEDCVEYSYNRYAILEKVYYYYDKNLEKYVEVLAPIMPCDEGSGLYGLEFSSLYLPDKGMYINVVYLKDDAPYPPHEMQYMRYYSEKFGKYMNVIVPPTYTKFSVHGYKIVDVYDNQGVAHKTIVKD